MPKKKKRPADVNVMAFQITEEATKALAEGKNPAAVALGRLGGLKGGPERDRRLSPKRKKEIAKKAAEARWKKIKK